MTIRDVAELLQVSSRQVYRLVNDAGLPRVRLIDGGDLRFRAEDISRWLATRAAS